MVTAAHAMRLPFALPRLAAIAMTILFALAAQAQEASPADKPLSAYRDKSRVLLVFTPAMQDPAYQEQTKLWQNEKAGFDERQLVVVPVLADAKKPAGDPPGTLAKRFGADAKSFTVVLVGKDGHDVYRSAKPVAASVVYATVDAMPMRRAEMRRQTSPSPSPSLTPRPTPAKPDLDHDE